MASKEIIELRAEIATLRKEIADLRAGQVAHHHHHQAPLPQYWPGYPSYPNYYIPADLRAR